VPQATEYFFYYFQKNSANAMIAEALNESLRVRFPWEDYYLFMAFPSVVKK